MSPGLLCALCFVAGGCSSAPGEEMLGVDSSPLQDIDAAESDPTVKRQLGSVAYQQPCDVAPEAPSGASCERYIVSCPGLDDARVELLTVNPSGPPRGVVLLGSGGPGTASYEYPLQAAIADAGFVAIERRWNSGWTRGDIDMVASACRYATLTKWIADNHDSALCITGNSGGSAEIAYALAHYDAESFVDLAMPTSGPPMAAMHQACDGDADWLVNCNAGVPDEICGGAAECSYGTGNESTIDSAYAEPICSMPSAETRELLENGSVVSPGADYDYPDTPVRFLFGSEDCTSAIPQGFVYRNAIASDVSHEILAVAHGLHHTAAGQARIAAILDTECVCRHDRCM